MPVIDASIVVDWVAPDVDPEEPAGQLLIHLAKVGAPLYAPRLLVEEVANALLTGCRRHRWDGDAADDAYQRLRQLPSASSTNPQIETVPGTSPAATTSTRSTTCSTWHWPSAWATSCSLPTKP